MALLFNNEERLKSLIAKLRQKFKVIVYIATSEDDYIAADDGNIDWLNNFSNELFDPKNGGEAAAGSLPDDCGTCILSAPIACGGVFCGAVASHYRPRGGGGLCPVSVTS